MSERPKPPKNCLRGGCDVIGQCSRCGFDRSENERRKLLPLVKGEDGLRRKIIPRKERPGDEREETSNE